MTIPNPEERRIFMDPPKTTCQKCINSNKKETEEPCASCKWLTNITRCKDCVYYEKITAETYDKFSITRGYCKHAFGLGSDYRAPSPCDQVHDLDYCSRAERRMTENE